MNNPKFCYKTNQHEPNSYRKILAQFPEHGYIIYWSPISFPLKEKKKKGKKEKNQAFEAKKKKVGKQKGRVLETGAFSECEFPIK